MAYQNVGTPRFYINTLEWLALNDAITLPSIFNTLPVNTTYIGSWNDLTGLGGVGMNVPFGTFYYKCFFAALGHTYSTNGVDMLVYVGNSAIAVAWGDVQINVSSPNTEGSDSGASIPLYDGFSLATLTNANFDVFAFNSAGECGSVIFGTYYDMPHSPDLKLTMTREYGGVKTIETKGGASLSNSFYTKPPAWGNLGAWEMSNDSSSYAANRALTKSGRRVWDLSFSHLQGSDVFGSNQTYGNWSADNFFWFPGGLTEGTTTGYGDDIESSGFTYNILTDYNFYSQVIHKTNGGQLPFIFQPDSSNNNPDQFAIAKLDMKSFKFDQVANSVYNCKIRIREVW